MRIGIMGLGYVGGTMKTVLEKAHELFCYDPMKDGYKDVNVLKFAEIIFLCVPTPMNGDRSEDLSYVYSACNTIKSLKTNPIVCIKSTVKPGTSRKISSELNLRVCNNPEFLTEKDALNDMLNSNRIIIGGDKEAIEKIKEVYLPLFPHATYKEMTSDESEMVKYAANAFLSAQVGFANEIYNICKALNIDYNAVKEAVLLDNRIGRHIDVPGPDGKLGFGGHCFPKDLNGLIYHSKESGYIPYLLEELWRFNKKQRK